MKTFRILFLAICILAIFSSCSNDDEPVMNQDPLIGMWEGVITQADYGTIGISIDITSLTQSNKSGNVSYASIDLSQCDEAIFICDHITCTGSWIYTGKVGSTYTFSEEFAAGADCGNGTIELSFTGSDKINYVWTEDFSDPSVASGILERSK